MAGIRSNNDREHRFAADNLSAYVDGELSARDDARIQEHLRHCASCRQDAATLRATARLLRQAPRQPLPRSFVLSPDAVAEQRSFRRWSLAQTWLRSASAVVSVLLVVLLSGDVILSRGWFSPRMAQSPPRMVQATVVPDEAVEMVVEKEVEMAPQAIAETESEAVLMTERAAPMITSVRPQSAVASETARAMPTSADAAAAPIAKMMPQPEARSQPRDELPAEVPMSVASNGQPGPDHALPRTSSAPGKGGGMEPESAAEEVAQEAATELVARGAQVRVLPTVDASPKTAVVQEQAHAPTGTPADAAAQAMQSNGAQASAQPDTPKLAVESARMEATPAPVVASRDITRSAIWTRLRSAALIAFGTLLMLLAGLLLVRQKIRD